ncbi:hypothetical protein [Apibacter sp. HY039]|uniref:hypothetical protein n=1 Tax=Apibacter sp. HY039 TaxID=2501476 RepID=UPI000FEC02BE|nr:hypothetical protein [Apibacter sp. HY039]
MKKTLLSCWVCLTISLLPAQKIEEVTFTEKNKPLEGFGFKAPVCNKDVLVNTWKTFIKKNGGKVKGGVINKVTGSEIQFLQEGNTWSGYFAYSFNEDNTLTIYTSFQDMQGDFLTSKNYKNEYDSLVTILSGYRDSILKECNLDDLNRARAYSNTLSKEKIRNSDRILYLEKSNQSDKQKVTLSEGKDLTEKEKVSIEKVKQRIISNITEIQLLRDKNRILDEQIKSQSLVIQRFETRKDHLEKGIELSSSDNADTSETVKKTDENTRDYFDR